MCSKPVMNTVARVASGVVTVGASEVARKVAPNSIVSQALNTPGEIATAGMGSSGGLIDAGKKALIPKLPEPPPPTEDTPVEPPPTMNAPGSTTVDSLQAKRRKRLAAIRGGLTSTIATGPGGAQGVASLISPQAGGLKLKLGA